MASVSKRGKSYIVRYTYKNEKGESRPGWESYRTEKEAREKERAKLNWNRNRENF